jgi:hypothetical protein
VTVLSQETNEKKKFVSPDAFGRFLILENNSLVNQAREQQNEIAQSIISAQREKDNDETPEKEATAKEPAKRTPENI